MKLDDEIKVDNTIPRTGSPTYAEQNQHFNLNHAESGARSTAGRAMGALIKKHAADLLTLARVILGLFLAWSGLVDGRAALSRDIWILVLAWSTDMIDGRISRSLKTAHQTWLGRNDVYVDMFFSLTVLVYLTATGLLLPGIAVGYLLVWGALFLYWRAIPPLAAQVFQNPIYAYIVFLTFQSAPAVVPWLLLWAAVALLLFWRRMVELLRSVFGSLFGE